MGTQKLLLPFGASTVIGHITDQLLRCSLDQVLVVTGSDAPAVQAALKGQPVQFATNPDPDAEMLSSVRCGLAALPEGCDTVLLALGDQPGIQRELVEQLIQEHRSAEGSVVVPFYRGHRGHPFLFPARYRD